MKEKFCPLMMAGCLGGTNVKDPDLDLRCVDTMCQWWTSAFTTEDIEIFGCAMVIGAKTNSEGKIPV